jgi:hypothetical protein
MAEGMGAARILSRGAVTFQEGGKPENLLTHLTEAV